MLSLDVTLEQVIHLVTQLPPDGKRSVSAALGVNLSLDAETQDWLDADLGGALPDYDWGEAGVPEGVPVRYVVGEGVMIGAGVSAQAASGKAERLRENLKTEDNSQLNLLKNLRNRVQ